MDSDLTIAKLDRKRTDEAIYKAGFREGSYDSQREGFDKGRICGVRAALLEGLAIGVSKGLEIGEKLVEGEFKGDINTATMWPDVDLDDKLEKVKQELSADQTKIFNCSDNDLTVKDLLHHPAHLNLKKAD